MSSKKITRRDFVKLCGAASLALAAAPAGLVSLAEASSGPGRFVQTHLKMGTTVTLTAATKDADQAHEAFESAWREIDRLIAVFDRHQPGTAVSELNASGRLADPGPEMLEVLEYSAKAHLVSGGAFDPTVLPLLTLLTTDIEKKGRPPLDNEIAEILPLVDFKTVTYGKSGVRLGKQGQAVSFDGVAKGYIVDRAMDKMKSAGLKNALINAGGDIKAIGRRETGLPWRVAIQDPFNGAKYARIMDLSDQSVATSGSYEIFYDQEQKNHHLMDPKVGRSAFGLVSSTAVADTAAQADSMATAAFIKPQVLADAHVDGLVIDRTGRQTYSDGFGKLLARS
ncbi:MAG: FAD:protein FMN transferase [Pseudomonadota bacterium]